MRSAEARRQLVERLEQEAEQSPGRYRLKLALLAALGYAVLLVALAATLGLLLFIIGYMLVVRPPLDPYMAIPVIVLGLSGAVVWRALWIRFVVPPGHVLQAGEAPELHAEVERIRGSVGAEPLHGIVIDAELNAAAAYVPRGIGPWGQRHYLILGLPLLHALDRRELAAVIAHEFGHFHGGHGRFGGWIYRLRSSWQRLLEGMAGSGGMAGGQLLWLFFRWYAPYFDAYSQVLARRQEYAADAVGAQVASADAMTGALLRMARVSEWMSAEFWPDVHNSARGQAYPPIAVHEQLVQGMARERLCEANTPAWLLARQADPDDTHPTLAKRAAALEVDPLQPTGAPGAAAADMLGGLDASLQQRFSQEWRTSVEIEWKERHRLAQRERQRLAELQAHPAHTAAEALELACLVQDHQPGIDALPLFQEALARAPSSATGHYRLGSLLLARGDEGQGVSHLQQAMELDAALVEPSLQAMQRRLRGQPAESPLQLAAEALGRRYLARAQGTQAGDEDGLGPHALDPGQLHGLARALRGHAKVRRAWLVRRRLAGTEVMPHFLLLLDWSGSVASERAAQPRIASQIGLPGSCTVLTRSSDAALARRIRQDAGEAVYARP
ncbi:MAG: hypothetical protein EOP91_10145 [Lysobacteraceae bacterium]|nr:MAG: hypothetical protein EOP91_10145 [Xanthomonadaceae bacterium]